VREASSLEARPTLPDGLLVPGNVSTMDRGNGSPCRPPLSSTSKICPGMETSQGQEGWLTVFLPHIHPIS
jgi:hypothetical protein